MNGYDFPTCPDPVYAERDRYREALEQIMALDYTRAATNGCAHTAHKIATEAVRN